MTPEACHPSHLQSHTIFAGTHAMEPPSPARNHDHPATTTTTARPYHHTHASTITENAGHAL
eukprot:10032598-Prorocentrum_lima.AAC.1